VTTTVWNGRATLSSSARIWATGPMPKPPLGTSRTGRSSRKPKLFRTALGLSFAENFAEMGIPVTTTFSGAAPRATSRALVSSAATQYRSTQPSIHSACASKSVMMLTAIGLGPPRFLRR
jgi:hypothetical protein